MINKTRNNLEDLLADTIVYCQQKEKYTKEERFLCEFTLKINKDLIKYFKLIENKFEDLKNEKEDKDKDDIKKSSEDNSLLKFNEISLNSNLLIKSNPEEEKEGKIIFFLIFCLFLFL